MNIAPFFVDFLTRWCIDRALYVSLRLVRSIQGSPLEKSSQFSENYLKHIHKEMQRAMELATNQVL